MHDLGPPFERRAGGSQQRRDAREQPEAQRVVRPVRALRILVGIAGPHVKRGAVEQQILARFQQPRFHLE